jgi:aspartate-semialdehyde dehydrogenase
MDSDLGDGMAISIGRIEPCPVMGVKFFCLAHNTVRGAAGAAIANAELLAASGFLDRG